MCNYVWIISLSFSFIARLLGFHPEGFDSGNADTLASFIISSEKYFFSFFFFEFSI